MTKPYRAGIGPQYVPKILDSAARKRSRRDKTSESQICNAVAKELNGIKVMRQNNLQSRLEFAICLSRSIANRRWRLRVIANNSNWNSRKAREHFVPIFLHPFGPEPLQEIIPCTKMDQVLQSPGSKRQTRSDLRCLRSKNRWCHGSWTNSTTCCQQRTIHEPNLTPMFYNLFFWACFWQGLICSPCSEVFSVTV
ncbi:uncharacterized protein LY89DRAFT_137774 [Mollisia scopiformis]|uniref:Uncharacterized protein n=1 Tax=Mollisia scopiformis TaxID=149040 RepID=A0A194X3J3_MOLSC|nr:uncharacterized protein LY89DRAFT_137774 [Mollisia scopiformis]KUJ14397.1 hypothetical protein LY89DRAFT_137774 [Mollisia scopiformis]